MKSVFINHSKKGSIRFRKLLTRESLQYVHPHNNVKCCSNSGTEVGQELSKKMSLLWKIGFFNNSIRTFLFRLHNNTWGYNNVVAYLLRYHSANCTTGVRFVPCSDGDHPRYGTSAFKGFHTQILSRYVHISLYNAVHIYFSPLQVKNKPQEGVTCFAFILGPANMVTSTYSMYI